MIAVLLGQSFEGLIEVCHTGPEEASCFVTCDWIECELQDRNGMRSKESDCEKLYGSTTET